MESRKIYNIVITPMAAKDLNDTYDYIAAEYEDREWMQAKFMLPL